MAHRGGKTVEYASWNEVKRIEHLLANAPPKLSIIEGAKPKKTRGVEEQKNMRLHKIRSDESIKFVYGKNGKAIHDKSCSNLKGMNIESLCTSDVFLMNLQPCQECFLKACIRTGGDLAEIDRYQNFFDHIQISDKLLRKIYLVDGMKSEIFGNVLTLKYEEDIWKIQIAGKSGVGTQYVDLLQKNYRISDGKREFFDGFHVVCRNMSMREAVGYIESYVWRKPDSAPLAEKWSFARVLKWIKQRLTRIKTIYYIDGDNLIRERLHGIEELTEESKVKIFSSKAADAYRNPKRQRELRAKCRCQIEFHTVVNGRDATDFAIAMDMGKEIGRKGERCKKRSYFLISGDRHFDVIDRQVDYLTNYQVEVHWKKSISEGKDGK